MIITQDDQPLTSELYQDSTGELNIYTELTLACYIAGCALAGLMQDVPLGCVGRVQVVDADTQVVIREFKW